MSWSPAASLAAGGYYVLETSRNGFNSVDTTMTTTTTSIVIPTTASASDSTLFLRVRAVQSCGSVGPNSPVAGILLTAAPASYVITQAGPPWTAVKGAPPASGLSAGSREAWGRGPCPARGRRATRRPSFPSRFAPVP